jgi:hypothetical protein
MHSVHKAYRGRGEDPTNQLMARSFSRESNAHRVQMFVAEMSQEGQKRPRPL